MDLLTSPHRDRRRPRWPSAASSSCIRCRCATCSAAIEGYPALEEVVWVQEEPENMGAWEFVRPSLEGLAGSRRLAVLARPRSSSPAEGSAARHAQNQERAARARVRLEASQARTSKAPSVEAALGRPGADQGRVALDPSVYVNHRRSRSRRVHRGRARRALAEEGRRRRWPPASRSSSSRRTRWTSKCRRRRPACSSASRTRTAPT